MQLSIPFNSPSAIGICFGDSTRAACFRRRAAAEFWEARMQDARAGKRIGKREEETVRLHRSTAVETSTTQFALSRMTLLGFLVSSSILISRNMAHPGRPASPVYLETASRYSSDLSAFSYFILGRTKSLKLFLKY